MVDMRQKKLTRLCVDTKACGGLCIASDSASSSCRGLASDSASSSCRGPASKSASNSCRGLASERVSYRVSNGVLASDSASCRGFVLVMEYLLLECELPVKD